MNISKQAEHATHRRTRGLDSIDLSPALVVALEHVAAGASLSGSHLTTLIADRLVLLEKGTPGLTPLGELRLKRSRRQWESPVDAIGLVLADYVERYQQDLVTRPKRADTKRWGRYLPSSAKGEARSSPEYLVEEGAGADRCTGAIMRCFLLRKGHIAAVELLEAGPDEELVR